MIIPWSSCQEFKEGDVFIDNIYSYMHQSQAKYTFCYYIVQVMYCSHWSCQHLPIVSIRSMVEHGILYFLEQIHSDQAFYHDPIVCVSSVMFLSTIIFSGSQKVDWGHRWQGIQSFVSIYFTISLQFVSHIWTYSQVQYLLVRKKKGRQISQDRSFQPFKKPFTDTTVFSELHTLNIFLT